MVQNKDRRVRKTKKAITHALAELLQEKPLNSISVREISDVADINRGTFYLHYRDVYDMVEQLQNETFEKFNKIVDAHEHANNKNELFPMLVELFNLLAENAEFAKVLIGKNGDAAFVDKLKKITREKCFTDAKKMFNIENNDEFEYFYHFIVSGCIGIFSAWLTNGMTETPTEMAKLTKLFILNGAQMFK